MKALSQYTVSELQEALYKKVKFPKIKIQLPDDIYKYLKPFIFAQQEHFIVITLNGGNRVIKHHVISKGILNRSLVHPREVFRKAIEDNAASIIVVHNHPSGSPSYSEEDKAVTKMLKDAGKILGIELLDHIIVAEEGFFSFSVNGLI